MDLLLASSPHNLQYLLGGYRYFMYATMDSVGLSRYTPLLVYPRALPEASVYIGAGNEDWAIEVEPLWTPELRNVAWGASQAAAEAARAIRAVSRRPLAVGIEAPYLPAEAFTALRAELPDAHFLDATEVLEELRAVKTPRELGVIREASTAVVDAMLATFAATEPGDTKADIAERLRREETNRGLTFAYCLIAAGPSHNRAPCPLRLEDGHVLSLDSGAHRHGYVADLARMAVAGEVTPKLEELLAQVSSVQEAARAAVRPGSQGTAVFQAASSAMSGCPGREQMSFLAHGTGLVTHEAPRLTAKGSPPYPATHADRPLRAGMVLSIETHLADRDCGFIKLEDTVFVVEDGFEAVGDHGRGWNIVGA